MSKQELHIPDIPGISLVAYYGRKPLELEKIITDLQYRLQEYFGDLFFPYQLEQIHATIIGCEGLKTESGIVDKWFYRLRNEIRYIDYSGLLAYLWQNDLLPLDIYFGGYKPHINYQFLSRNQHPSDRSLQLQVSATNTLIPVMIGWSFENQTIVPTIDLLRRNLQQFNCLHKYHKFPQDIDNDLYLRLGTIKGNFAPDLIVTIQREINYYLQNRSPQKITLSQQNLSIIEYRDLSLSPETSQTYSLSDLDRNPDLILQLYS